MKPCYHCSDFVGGFDEDMVPECNLSDGCSRLEDYMHALRRRMAQVQENHRWADPEHPSDGRDYCSIGRENRYQRY